MSPISQQPQPQQHGSQHVEIQKNGEIEVVFSGDPEKVMGSEQVQRDYSGARAKTDAKEIALVRKLDRRLLPMLCVMYFLNYVSRVIVTRDITHKMDRTQTLPTENLEFYSIQLTSLKLDKSAIASARLNHLETDLNLKDNQYNTCVSILFVGYVMPAFIIEMSFHKSNFSQVHFDAVALKHADGIW